MPACVFSDEEVKSLLRIIRETDAFRKIDGRVQRNEEVFNDIASIMNDGSQPENCKTAKQLRTKWKALKRIYLEEKKNQAKSGKFKF